MITKETKNLIRLKSDFYKISPDKEYDDMINLEENEDDFHMEKDIEKIINKNNSLKNELNHVNNLIHYLNEKLLLYENNRKINLDKIININTYENKLEIINIKDKNKGQLFSVIKIENEKSKDFFKKNNKENFAHNLTPANNNIKILEKFDKIFEEKEKIRMSKK